MFWFFLPTVTLLPLPHRTNGRNIFVSPSQKTEHSGNHEIDGVCTARLAKKTAGRLDPPSPPLKQSPHTKGTLCPPPERRKAQAIAA